MEQLNLFDTEMQPEQPTTKNLPFAYSYMADKTWTKSMRLRWEFYRANGDSATAHAIRSEYTLYR